MRSLRSMAVFRDAALSLFLGAALGVLVLRLVDMPLRWAVAFALVAVFALALPPVGWLTRRPERLLWIALFVSIPLDFDVHLTYREYVGTYNGILFNITDAAYLVLAGKWILQKIQTGRMDADWTPAIVLPAFGCLLAQIASLSNALDLTFSLFSLVQNAKVFLCFLFLADRLRTLEEFQVVWRLLLWCLILESTICFLQFATRTNYTTAMKTAENYGEDLFRVGGTTGSPNVTASYLASLLPIPLVYLFERERSQPVALAVTAAAMGLIALVLTQTRGAWLNFMIGMAVFLIVTRKIRSGWKIALAVLPVVIVLMALFHTVLTERFTAGFDTLEYRIQLIRSAFRMVQTHPWFGVGVNNYAEVMADYVPFFLTQERWIVHNRYLLVASETGLVGLAVFLWTVVAVLRVVWQARRTQSPFLSGFALSLFFSLLIFFLQMAVESLDGRISDSHLWLIAGIGAALAGQAKRHPLPHPPIGRGSA